MRFYHRTTSEAASAIVAGGFRDAEGIYMTDRLHRGVWLSDFPLDVNEGADGDTLLAVLIDLPESDLAQYEWVQKPSFGYREWLIPAAVVNAHGRVYITNEDLEPSRFDAP